MDNIVVTQKMLHDIRNALNSVLGYSQILQDEDELCEEHKKMLLSIENAASKIRTILWEDRGALEKERMSQAQSETALPPLLHVGTQKGSGNSKILIIDDKEENLSLFSGILSPYGYDVRVASSGEEGLRTAKEFLPDLILLDVVMPRMSGYDVLRELKEEKLLKDTPVIFLTAKDTAEDIVKGFNEGASDYVAKPFYPKELIARVNAHMLKARLFAGLKKLMEETSHELYTPLSIISSAMQMQEMEHERTDYTQMALAACKSMQSIYDDLYYSIGYSDKARESTLFDLGELIRRRTEYFSLVAQSRSLGFRLDIPDKTPLLQSQEEMQRVADNLLSNAIKYAKEGSEISVSIIHKDSEWELLVCNPTSKEIDADKVFQKYDRQHDDVLGLGIGLDLVRSICKKNDIEISALAQNRRFCIKMRGRMR